MKKTYIVPKSSILAADVCDDLMISGSTAGTQIIEEGGSAHDEGIVDADARPSINTWEEW